MSKLIVIQKGQQIFRDFWLFLFLFLVLNTYPPSIFADDISHNSKKLNTIIQKIHKLEKYISLHKSKRKNLQNELKQTEIHIGKVAQEIKEIRKQLSKIIKTLDINKTKQFNYQKQLVEQKQLLIDQVGVMYKLGKQPLLKLILNQENPEELSRNLRYYEYLNKIRLNIIYKIKNISGELKKTEQNIYIQKQRLKKIQSQKHAQQQVFVQEKHHRQALLTKMETTIQDEHQQLAQLRTDKKRLEIIIRTLQQEKMYSFSGKPFTRNQHSLSWPVSGGKIIQRFGQFITGTQLRSTGLIISAPTGTNVYAISSGKVIFADWLRGFGLLTIIQHDKAYVSLYGRNQSLYVKPDQIVQIGDIIATVGNSGGFINSALYFEIRHKNVPVNPQKWLKKIKHLQ